MHRSRNTDSNRRSAAHPVLQHSVQILLPAAARRHIGHGFADCDCKLPKVFDSPFAGSHVTVIWHAGEPLVLPVSYYESAFQAIERIRPSGVSIQHAFQTNGTLVTKAWCDLFRPLESWGRGQHRWPSASA